MVNDGVEVDAITEFRQRHLQGIEAIEQVGAEALCVPKTLFELMT
jgi:hypothetical protein